MSIVAKRERGLKFLVGGLIIALLAGGLLADQAWFDRHFLPIFAFQRTFMVSAERGLRGFVILAAMLLVVIGPLPIARRLGRASAGGIARVALAVVLALGASEMILRLRPLHPHDADPLALEPRRQPDARLGWRFVPSRSVVAREGGRAVSYNIDAAGHRVAVPGAAIDAAKPTLIFTGESIIAGFGLAWDQTIPALVGASLGIQSANLGVSDFSNDQSTLRLADELPRFKKPVAVMTLFMPSLLDRNLLSNRPHLGPGLVWQPPQQQWRLAGLLHWLVPYRSKAAIDQGIVQTRDSLGALVRLACSRGAQPLIIVPQFGAATPVEEDLRHRVLDQAGLPYVLIKLDPAWHLPGDAHPDARGARAIAAAVVARLEGSSGSAICLSDKQSPTRQ